MRASSEDHKGRQDVLPLIKLLAPLKTEYKPLFHFKNDLKCKQRAEPLANGESWKVEEASLRMKDANTQTDAEN